MTTSAYGSLTTIEQVFKDLVWAPALTAGETALETAVPFLGWPVVSTITNWIIGNLGDLIYNELVLLIDVEAIKLVNAAHQAAYDSASEQLKIIATDKGTDSDEYKKARDAAKAAMANFTDINTTA